MNLTYNRVEIQPFTSAVEMILANQPGITYVLIENIRTPNDDLYFLFEEVINAPNFWICIKFDPMDTNQLLSISAYVVPDGCSFTFSNWFITENNEITATVCATWQTSIFNVPTCQIDELTVPVWITQAGFRTAIGTITFI